MQESGMVRKKEHVLSAKTVRLIAQNKKLENDLAGLRSLSSKVEIINDTLRVRRIITAIKLELEVCKLLKTKPSDSFKKLFDMKTIIAIDPGASGGIALCNNSVTLACPMPETEGDIISWIVVPNRTAIQNGSERIAYIEEVGGYCGESQPGSAMFKFGRNFGFILGALQALGWRIELVKPQKWQKHFGLGTKAASGGKTAWKNKLKAHAQRLFPEKKVTLKTADALLLLEYARHHTQA